MSARRVPSKLWLPNRKVSLPAAAKDRAPRSTPLADCDHANDMPRDSFRGAKGDPGRTSCRLGKRQNLLVRSDLGRAAIQSALGQVLLMILLVPEEGSGLDDLSNDRAAED